MNDDEMAKYIAIGERNRDALPLIHNWCSHARVVVDGGVGMIEQMTGLPIGRRRIACDHQRGMGISSMHLVDNAIDFYDRNCASCKERDPVRIPNLLQLVQARDELLEREAEQRRSRETREAEALAGRVAARLELRSQASPALAGVLDLIDTLDRGPSEETARVLVEAARAVPETFDRRVAPHVLALAETGERFRTRSSLEVLELVGIGTDAERRTLLATALRATRSPDTLGCSARIRTISPTPGCCPGRPRRRSRAEPHRARQAGGRQAVLASQSGTAEP